jgi:hypothetical protein
LIEIGKINMKSPTSSSNAEHETPIKQRKLEVGKVAGNAKNQIKQLQTIM